MTSVRTKVESLLARATHESTPAEEARTSAVIACKLIVEHKLLNAAAQPSPQDGWSTRQGPFGPERVRYEEWPPKQPASWTRQKREWQKGGWKLFKSKFNGTCKCCGNYFNIGDMVAWKPEEGSTHRECASHWTNECQCFEDYDASDADRDDPGDWPF